MRASSPCAVVRLPHLLRVEDSPDELHLVLERHQELVHDEREGAPGDLGEDVHVLVGSSRGRIRATDDGHPFILSYKGSPLTGSGAKVLWALSGFAEIQQVKTGAAWRRVPLSILGPRG